MSHPHSLSDLPIAPELLGHSDEDMDAAATADLAAATANVLAEHQVAMEAARNAAAAASGSGGDHGDGDELEIDPNLGAKWEEFAASAHFYPQGSPSDFSLGHDHDHEHGDGGASLDINDHDLHDDEEKLHTPAEEAGGEDSGENGGGLNASLADGLDVSESPAADADAAGEASTAAPKKRKRAPRDPSAPSARKRIPMITDPNDPLSHLQLPTTLQGRSVEYATAPLEDTRQGPVFIHPPQGTVQACVRCHGIKRKCEALSWRMKTDADVDTTFGNLGGVVWDKPRCSGCEKADVPCVFELAAASSGFVHSLRSEATALAEELTTARQRIQELEISLAVSQTNA